MAIVKTLLKITGLGGIAALLFIAGFFAGTTATAPPTTVHAAEALSPAPTQAPAPDPTPTPTPSPPATVASCPTTFEAAWLQVLRDGIPAIEAGLAELGDLSAQVEADPSLVAQADFRAAYVAKATEIRARGRQILDFTLTPPLRNPELYGSTKTMARAVVHGMEQLVDAFDHFEAGQALGAEQALHQAASNIDDAVFYLDGLVASLDSFCTG